MEAERDELYDRFVKSIHDVQQKTGFKNLLLEKKLSTLADQLEKKVRSSHNLIVRLLMLLRMSSILPL